MSDYSLAPVLNFVLDERQWPRSARLEALAGHLPPIPCAGLELHLGNDARTDLQLRVKSPADWARLRFFLSHHGPADPGGGWAVLARLCRAPDLPVEEVWLEADDAGSDAAPPLSIFARLTQSGAGADVAGALDTVRALLAACGTGASASQWSMLETCLCACREGAALTHIGMMLGRAHSPLRLIVEQIPATDFAGFLDRAGIGARGAEVQQRVDTLFAFADRIRLALTLGERWHDDIGLECFVGDGRRSDPRIEQMLHHLVAAGLLDTTVEQRLLAWPARLYPHEVQGGWPGSLIAQALAEGAAPLPWLDCRISHVKLTLHAGRSPEAKAYFGFVQEAPPPPAADPEPARPRATSAALAEAIDAGSRALLAARNQAGWWLDYDGFSEGVSDEWVTAYVACACLALGSAEMHAAAMRAWSLLSLRERAGWGWNFTQPADADSTAWGLRLAHRLGCWSDAAAQAALGLLRMHIGSDGAVATYLRQGHAARFPGRAIHAGWYEPHADVTAAVAGLPGLEAASLAWLAGRQQPDGNWPGYWWSDPAYATAIAAVTLAETGDPAARPAVARAAEAARRRLAQDAGLAENPFALALTLRTSILAGTADRALVAQRARDLLAMQAADGMWPGTAALRFPNAEGRTIDAMDRAGIFTTATVLETLAALRRAEAIA